MRTAKGGVILVGVVAGGIVIAGLAAAITSYFGDEGNRTQGNLDSFEACMLRMTPEQYKAATTGAGVTEQGLIELAIAIERARVEDPKHAAACAQQFGL